MIAQLTDQPVSISMGLVGLVAFIWSLHHNQLDELDGDAERILTTSDTPETPIRKDQFDG